METTLFYILALGTVVFGFLVVANPFSRNPVTSAMFLVLTITAMAGLFVLLHAFFLAAIQVLVYAGAVMVLFLFVIMLLDLPVEERRKIKLFSLITGILGATAILYAFLGSLVRTPPRPTQTPTLEGSTLVLGKALFSDYVLPFEIVSLLLLAGMVGVVLLSKKDLK